MSDPLSITASILTLVSAGFAVAKGLHQLAESIGSAGKEIQIYADEINSLNQVLQNVREEIQQPETKKAPSSGYAESLLRDIVEICERVLDPLNRIQKILNPLLDRLRNDARKLSHLGARIQWLFKDKEKLLFYQHVLRSQKGLLDTMLLSLILRKTNERTTQNTYVLQVSLQNAITVSTLAFDPQSNQDRLPSTSRPLPMGPNTNSSSPHSVDHTVVRKDSNASVSEAIQIDDPSSALVISPLSSRSEAALDQEDVQSMDAVIEKELDSSYDMRTEELYQDIQSVSRRVRRFASETMQSSANGKDAQEAPNSEKIEQDRRVITLKHADESTYTVPYKIFLDLKTVQETKSFLQRICEFKPVEPDQSTRSMQWTEMHLNVHLCQQRAIDTEKFDLVDHKGDKILLSFLPALVQPNWVLTLRFHDSRLNGSDLSVAHRTLGRSRAGISEKEYELIQQYLFPNLHPRKEPQSSSSTDTSFKRPKTWGSLRKLLN